MAAIKKTLADIKTDFIIGSTVPSCPNKIAPFILQNHQLYIAKYLNEIKDQPNNSLLLWHGLGSGKTISSIATAFQTADGRDIVVSCTASLIDNYQEELSRYADKVREFIDMPMKGVGLAIETANMFINECKIQGVNDDWVKPFIEKLILQIGNDGPIENFFDIDDIRAIVASKDEATFNASLTPLKPPPPRPLPGGRSRRNKKKQTRRTKQTKQTKRGGYKEGMRSHNINFIFKSYNGTLNRDGFGDLSNVSLIIIDESQLLVSQLRQDYSNIDLRRNPIKGTPQLDFGVPLIQMTDFLSHVTTGKGTGRPKAYRLYNELMHRPQATQLVLLSATPIIKNKYEIAIAVNILAREELMPVNESVFEHNYGLERSMTPYDYAFSNERRTVDVVGKIYARIKNDGEFRKCCSGRASFFGNIKEMMPILILFQDKKHIYNNAGTPFINIIECPLTRTQALRMKYLQFVCDPNGLNQARFGALKPQFADCAFPLNSPTINVTPPPPRNLDENGFSSGRADEMDDVIVRFTHSFQTFLSEEQMRVYSKDLEMANAGDLKSPEKPTLSAEEKRVTKIVLGDLMDNGKIKALMEKITANSDRRHVIYATSRYVAVIIGRILTQYNYIELLNPKVLIPGVVSKDNMFAFLRGESQDNNDPVTMFKYTEDEGNSENKSDLIKLFNDETTTNLKILIINNCVAEGITLKRVDFIHVFSLPYDIAKLQQIVARVYRNCVHPPGGTVTPYLYLSVGNDSIIPVGIYQSLYPENAAWQTYARTFHLEPDREKNELVAKINENDALLPYYRILQECSIEAEIHA